MNRREILQRMGGVLALALSPTLPGCATARGPSLESMADVEPVHLAVQLRERMAALRSMEAFPLLGDWTASRGYDRHLLGEVAATMWLSATFRDLPSRVRREPEVQRWLLDEGPRVARAMYEVADLLEGLTPDERADLASMLATRPELLADLTEGFDVHAERRGVEPERREQARALLDHTAWRLRHQSPDAVIDELLHRFDRVCKRNGVDRRDWRRGLDEEIPIWRSLELLNDPDGTLAAEAASAVDPGEIEEPLATEGTHLGLTLRRERREAVVEHVVRDSPAARAGVRPGDVLAAVDDRPMDGPALVGWLATRSAGEPVSLTLQRDGETVVASATLGAGPGDRLLVDRPGAAVRGRVAFLTGAWTVAGVGIVISAVGAGSFGLGVLFLLAGGGYMEGIGAVGAVMTVLGILIIGVGLLVFLVGLLVVAAKHGGSTRNLSEPEEHPEDLPEGEPAPAP